MKNFNTDNDACKYPKERFPTIIVGATNWALNGVNIFSANLVRGLQKLGISAHILLTEEKSALVRVTEARMERPSDIHFEELPVARRTSWGGHWGAMIQYLENRTPCIYIPNSDWRHSCVIPLLSRDVGIIGVVHSDDPLHYDHIGRLGKYWNAITATSNSIAERTVELNPEFSERLTTIFIGVDIPFTPPQRDKNPSDPLKLIYHGTLKQHQKRILDLPEIMSKLAKEGLPVQLNIVGGGPDEDRVIKASEDLVNCGFIRFHGVVPHNKVLEILEQNDVYLLASEFEGMPNALLEAMGRGCVPIVTNMESAVPQLVEDGHNGYVVPIGDIDAFTERIKMLHQDPNMRRIMSLKAYETVSKGNFRIQDMVQAYTKVIERVVDDTKQGIYKRPKGILKPPPKQVAGVDIFPLETLYKAEDIGFFPVRIPDFRDFKEQIKQLKDPRRFPLAQIAKPASHSHVAATEKLTGVKVFVASPSWTQNAVNEFSANLVRELLKQGISAEILITEENTDLVNITEAPMPRPSGVPSQHLPVSRTDSWGAHWGAMIRYLEERAPCIYIPNYDWRHSCVSPMLSDRVAIVGVVHSDDLLHYDHVKRLGRYWNGIVAVSHTVAKNIQSLDPAFAERTAIIPYGLDIPDTLQNRQIDPEASLKIVCHGVFEAHELEMLRDMLDILRRRKSSYEVTIISAAGKIHVPLNLLDDFKKLDTLRIVDDYPKDKVLALFERSDVFIGMPKYKNPENTLLEAMGRGCIPVLMQKDQKIDLPEELLGAVDTSCKVSAGNIGSLVDQLMLLRQNVERRRQMSLNAYNMANDTYRTVDMARDYLGVFDWVVDEVRMGTFRRPKGILKPPPAAVAGTKIFPIELSFKKDIVGLFPKYIPDYIQFKRAISLNGRKTILEIVYGIISRVKSAVLKRIFPEEQ